MNLELILTVATLHFVALISPGPDFILIMKNTLTSGKKVGFFTGLGFGLGIAVHAAYSIGGIAILISNQPALFNIIKQLGAAYILYMGLAGLYGSLKNKDSSVVLQKNITGLNLGVNKAFTQGFLTNILNPKATMAILGIYTAVIPQKTDFINLLGSAIVMVSLTIIWFSIVAFFFDAPPIRDRYLKKEKVINIIFACLFISAGIALFLETSSITRSINER